MTRKYLAFDIETAKEVPGEVFDWKPHRPLGICCAAALPGDAQQPIVWHGTTADGKPAPRLSLSDAKRIVDELAKFVADGYTLVTWNGLGFDLDVLAEEANARQQCQTLALNHVDLMFHVFCDRGFPISLEKAAQGMKIPGKPEGISGEVAPQLWAQGRFEEVINYVSHDVRIALQIAVKCDANRRFDWITGRGKKSSVTLPQGWFTVRDALKLPLPDTSWMDAPIPRRRFTGWLDGT